MFNNYVLIGLAIVSLICVYLVWENFRQTSRISKLESSLQGTLQAVQGVLNANMLPPPPSHQQLPPSQHPPEPSQHHPSANELQDQYNNFIQSNPMMADEHPDADSSVSLDVHHSSGSEDLEDENGNSAHPFEMTPELQDQINNLSSLYGDGDDDDQVSTTEEDLNLEEVELEDPSEEELEEVPEEDLEGDLEEVTEEHDQGESEDHQGESEDHQDESEDHQGESEDHQGESEDHQGESEDHQEEPEDHQEEPENHQEESEEHQEESEEHQEESEEHQEENQEENQEEYQGITSTETPLTRKQLNKMNLLDLRNMAIDKGMGRRGNKQQLVDRLSKYYEAQS